MRLLRALAPVVCLIAVLVTRPAPFAAFAAGAERTLHRTLGSENVICRLYLDPHDRPGGVHAPARSRQSMSAGGQAAATLSQIQVSYSGFSAEAQNAFQAAVNIWASQVQSNVPIQVDATFEDLEEPLLLGSAGATCAFANFTNAPRIDTWFPNAIANRLSNSDLLPAPFHPCDNPADLAASFNSTANWYFGVDGNVPGGKVDFVSVVLHELGHGLGFFGTGSFSPGTGAGTVGSGGRPYIYDVSVSDAPNAGNSLINTGVYPSPSTALGTALTSQSLYWDGTNGKSANGGTRPRLYAPASFQHGSSYSHLDENTYPGAGPNSLMTPVIAQQQFIHTPGPITLGMFADMGWSSSAGCTFTLSATTLTAAAAGGTLNVTLSTDGACQWTASSNAAFVTIPAADQSGTGMKVLTLTVAANAGSSARIGTATIGGQTLQINQNGTGPTMALDRTSLIFSAVTTGAAFTSQTPPQTVRMVQSGAGTISWTATSNQPWLRVGKGSEPPGSSTFGTGSATLSVAVQFTAGLASTQTGTITFSSNAGNIFGPITVTLNALNAGAAPFGSFDTPADQSNGVTGSIAVTGWALDDIGVTGVQIWRVGLPSEGGGPVFIGHATMVDGARPDVAALHPSLPQSTRAGWGYLMLTNFLPNQGNGTFTIYAMAVDAEGKFTTLGIKTIICTNSSAETPFGAIDTPAQGGTASGTLINFGWVLARGPDFATPNNGGTVRIVIDGAQIAAVPGSWTNRSDLTDLFDAATYPGIPHALGVAAIDTTTMTNGVHTISWNVFTNTGKAAGIGSRYFTVSNGSGLSLDPDAAAVKGSPVVSTPALIEMPRAAALRNGGSAVGLANEIAAAAQDRRPITGQRGFSEVTPLRRYRPAANGIITVQSEELDRIELRLGGGQGLTGYMRSGSSVVALPIGSALNAATGVFTWQPGVGFVGSYDLAFVRWAGGRAVSRHDVRVVLNPRGSNLIGPQVMIDLPAAGSRDVDARSFIVAGWAADLDSTVDGGVDTVHVWAYPASGDAPIFIGAAAFGGSRPDVAAVYGERFGRSGYGIEVKGLPSGTYDIAVFAYSTVSDGFVPAKTARVRIR